LKPLPLIAILIAALLSACGAPDPLTYVYPEYSGPVAAPQTVYRIDENRYFEIVPYENMPCARARLYYTDKAQGIHSRVAHWDSLRDGTLIIDAANTNYLVSLIIDSNADCGADTSASAACSKRLPYSTDGGRTWKFIPTVLHEPMRLIGSKFYVGSYFTDVVDLSKPVSTMDDWTRYPTENISIPKPRKAPLDTEFHCIRNGKE